MTGWKEWQRQRRAAQQPGQNPRDVVSPRDVGSEAAARDADSLAREVSNGVQDSIVTGAGVDRSSVDVLVSGNSLNQGDVPRAVVDVCQAGVAEMVERESPVESGSVLPCREHSPQLSSTERSSVAGDKQRIAVEESFPSSPLPGDELLEPIPEGVGDKDLLGDGAGSAGPLEDSEGDPPSGDDLVATAAKDISDGESADLKAPEPGAESQSDDAVVPKTIYVMPGDPEYETLLGNSKSRGGFTDIGGEGHSSILSDLADKNKQKISDSGAKNNSSPHGKSPAFVVKRDEHDFGKWIATEPGFLSVIARFDDSKIKLEPYQKQFLKTKANYRCVEKSRQVGFSWLFAAEAIARCHLRNTHNSIFVSYNLADSKEKIAYAAQMHEELPLEFQKKLEVNSKLELGFISNSAHRRMTRIISHPSRAPRGKKGDIYLDELAHYANDRDVYKGSTALILRSRGQLTICSSPLGRRGLFWEISRQEIRPYKNYWRQKIPWWLCSFFRKDRSTEGLLAAARECPTLPTKERVYKHGHQGIVEQFEGMPLDDFQQEFEVLYVDESMAFFPYDLILPSTNEELELADDFTQIKPRKDSRLVAGFDVGRKKDLSELSVFEEDASGKKVCRGLFSYKKTAFKAQEGALRQLMDLLPIAKLYIDQNGIGMHLAENLSDDYPQVEPFTFSTASKEVLANDFKIGLQNMSIVLPRDRSLTSQIHSIRKRTTAAGRVIFESNDGSEGHADRFWSVAMACQKERTVQAGPSEVSVTIIN